MQSCLGIYIEDNLIKYAKVQKDRDNIKEHLEQSFMKTYNKQLIK